MAIIASMNNSCHGCFAAQDLTEWIKLENNGNFNLLDYFICAHLRYNSLVK